MTNLNSSERQTNPGLGQPVPLSAELGRLGEDANDSHNRVWLRVGLGIPQTGVILREPEPATSESPVVTGYVVLRGNVYEVAPNNGWNQFVAKDKLDLRDPNVQLVLAMLLDDVLGAAPRPKSKPHASVRYAPKTKEDPNACVTALY